MDIEAIYSTIRDKKGEKLSADSFNINVRDINGNSLLHLAAISDDVETSKELLNKGAVYNVKNNEGKTPLRVAKREELQTLYRNIRMFFKAVKKSNFDKVSNYIMDEKFLVNVKDESAGTALHWAVSKNNNDIIKLLLENGADVLQVTDKGNTALHTAVYTGNAETVELLLKGVPEEKLSELVNFQTFGTKSTSLHFSAEDGYFEIVKILLKHGAVYNMKNKKGDIPCKLAGNTVIRTFLELIKNLFSCAKNGVSKPFAELNEMNASELEAIMNVRDISNNTILQVLESHGHSDLADTMLETITQKDRNIPEWRFNELEMLEYSANVHCRFSKTYVELLSAYSRPSASGINTWPWKTLKEGSYLLGNAYKLVSNYKSIRPGPIEDVNIKIIDDTLQKLQFHPSHISSGYTMEAYEGKAQCFLSKAEGTEYYYELLHSDSVNDVRFFLELTEKNINAPVESFLLTLKERFLLFPTSRLKTVIIRNSESEVLNCIEKGADVNFVYDTDETPLICAVKCGFPNILEILLKNGADVHQCLDEGNSILHIAVTNTSEFKYSKSHIPLESTQCLLKYGAKYNCKDKDGRTPLDVSQLADTTALLRKIHDCFSYAEKDNPAVLRWLQLMNNDEFQAVTQSRNVDGYTLLQLAVSRHNKIEKAILEIVQGASKMQPVSVVDDQFERKLNKIKNLAEKYVDASKAHLPVLQAIAYAGDYETNSSPWKSLMEGSYYLLTAYDLVHEYKNTQPIFPGDANIERISNGLNQLQFNPKHITSFGDNKKDSEEYFISAAEGTEFYYRLLCSNYQKNIRQFLEIAEEDIDMPAKKFMEKGILSQYRMEHCVIL